MNAAFVTGGTGLVGRALLRRLVERGVRVRALARTPQAEAIVTALGATPVPGDLSREPDCRDADVVFHVAASMDHTRGEAALREANVLGTERVLAAAKRSGARRFVHVSTAAVYAGGPPLVQATEAWPLPAQVLGLYPRTKAEAEVLVQRSGLDAVIVRPALVWGLHDRATLPQLVAQVRSRRFSWIDGGHFPFSTCHAQNLAEALCCAAERGVAGAAYFVTDGPPRELRAFLSALLETQGVDAGARSSSLATVLRMATLLELPWKVLPLRSPPPTHLREVALLMGRESTLDDTKARTELGYAPVLSIEAGLAELKTAA